MNFLAVTATIAVLAIFPVIIFLMLVRAVREQGTRWWGIIILLSILTCYCTVLTGVFGLISGSYDTGTAAMEQHYCEQFREVLAQTETLPEALARMDEAVASDEYLVKEPAKNLRFRFVWLLAGCFLFAGANLMMFAPGRRKRRHPTDCMVMIVAALVAFLTGIWQIAWGNGYAYQAGAYRRMLTGWHEAIHLDAIHATNAEIASELPADKVKKLNSLWAAFLELSGEKVPGMPEKKENKPPAPGIAIIGGADGPTAVFVGSELLKKQSSAPATTKGKEDLPEEEETPAESAPAAEEENAAD